MPLNPNLEVTRRPRLGLMTTAALPYVTTWPRKFDLTGRFELDVWADGLHIRKKKRLFDARLVFTLEGLPLVYEPKLQVVGSLEEGYDVVAVAHAPGIEVKCTVHERRLSPHHGPPTRPARS